MVRGEAALGFVPQSSLRAVFAIGRDELVTVFAIPGNWIPALPAGMTRSGPADFTT